MGELTKRQMQSGLQFLAKDESGVAVWSNDNIASTIAELVERGLAEYVSEPLSAPQGSLRYARLTIAGRAALASKKGGTGE